MPQTVTITKTLFSFDELSDAAKERARDWYRSCPFDSDFDCVIEEFANICGHIGIDFATHEVKLMGGGKRSEPNIWWSGFCQSDYASFEGTYDYRPDACLKLREMNNDDKWPPLRIAIKLARIQADNAFGIRAVVKERSPIEVYDKRNECREIGDVYDEVKECMRDLMRWLYKQLDQQNDYINSNEYIDESIEVNEYTFDEEGNRDG